MLCKVKIAKNYILIHRDPWTWLRRLVSKKYMFWFFVCSSFANWNKPFVQVEVFCEEYMQCIDFYFSRLVRPDHFGQFSSFANAICSRKWTSSMENTWNGVRFWTSDLNATALRKTLKKRLTWNALRTRCLMPPKPWIVFIILIISF